MGSPYRLNAIPLLRARSEGDVVRFEAAMRTTRRHGRLFALALVAGLAAVALAPLVLRAPDLRPPTRELAVVRPSFWSPARTLYPVTAPPLPWPWGPPCDLKEACDF